MNFSEAIEKLKLGCKVTRESWWKNGLYLTIEDNRLVCYTMSLEAYGYTPEIILSDGWIVSDMPGTHGFGFMIDALKAGHTAKLENWTYSYICICPQENEIILSSRTEYAMTILLSDFMAKDWMVVE